MIKNIDDTLVNGAIGKVTAFMTEEEWGQRGDPPTAEKVSDTKSKMPASKGTGARWPVVKFKIPGTENKFREELVKSEMFKVEGVNGTIEASRSQVSPASLLGLLDSLTLLRLPVGSSCARLGSVHPQVAGADHSKGEGRFKKGFRERYVLTFPRGFCECLNMVFYRTSICRNLPCDLLRGFANPQFPARSGHGPSSRY